MRDVARALGIALAIVACPLLARAERGDCDFGVSNVRTCDAPMGCATRAECIGPVGTADWTCQSVGGAASECLPDCSTMFSCGSSGDCPMLNGLTGTCSPTLTAPMLCTWAAMGTSSVPPWAQITYCVPAGNHISDSNIGACHRIPGSSPAVFTDDYFRGDCDDDGCPNGFDTNPCVAARGSCTPASGTAAESPFCAPPPALACVPSGTGFTCGDARPCDPSSTTLPCDVGTCDDSWSDVPRCRPPCGTLFACRSGVLPGGGTPAEQCPELNGSAGTCLSLGATIPGAPGRDGLCVYSDFFDASCASSTISSECFVDPSGALTPNFWQGDCDRDGAPNGCDTMRCASGGGTSACVDVGACSATFVPPVDAGVDGGNVAQDDAGSDAGSSTGEDASAEDAATAPDASGSGVDASAGIDGGVNAGFSGGGGCRCAAVGVRARPWGGAALFVLALGVVMRRRARR